MFGRSFRFAALFALSPAAGCGAAPETPASDASKAKPKTAVAPAEARPASPVSRGALHRKEVVAVVERGLGAFLQRVSVEPRFHGGRFRGWSLVRLLPADFWSGVDLRPGDVVVEVNGKSIERPEQAHEVFEGLRTAERLVIRFERAGEARELSYAIEPRAGAGTPRAAGRD
jgi:type II secretory pathway component PulC